jgi:general secretion pathway protein K
MKKLPGLLGDERGVVLLLVLATIALFTVMVVNFSADEGLDIQLAYNFRDSMQAQYMARSGVEAAIAMLKKDDVSYDGEDEDWGSFNEYTAAASQQYLGGQLISGTITDESGRFDLNSLAKGDGQALRIKQFKRLFELLDIETEVDLNELAANVRDWVDTDDDDGGDGAEDKYYMSLETPYHCKNAPFDSPEEILLVKGMKPEYYYGTENYKGIKDYVTAGSGGTINVNTASDIVLKSLSDSVTDKVVQTIKDGRPWKQKSGTWTATLGISPASTDEAQWMNKVLTNTTPIFRADMLGTLPSGAQISIMALLQRVQSDVKIVYYKIY